MLLRRHCGGLDSFHRITTTTAMAIDLVNSQCSVGPPLTIITAAATNDMVNSEHLIGCDTICVWPVDHQTGKAGRL